MHYLLESSLLITLFYACHKLLLEKETFFQNIRWFLLLGLVASVILPLMVIPNYIEYQAQPDLAGYQAMALHVADNQPNATAPSEILIDWTSILWSIYLVGIMCLSFRLIVQLLSLHRVIADSKNKLNVENMRLLETSNEVPPFSFFNHIVYNPSQFSSEELNLIVSHEIAHVKGLHSLDLLIATIASILFWFNPFIWLYKKSIRQNLEFIADSYVKSEVDCDVTYQKTILKACVGRQQLSITNNFSNSSIGLRLFGKVYTFGKPLKHIKKRIIMLQSSKSNAMRQLKFLIVLPLIAFFMMSFNTTDVYIPDETSHNIQQDTTEHWNVLKFTINKTTTDKQLDDIKKRFAAKNAKVNFNKVQRNANGYIIGIQVDFKSEKTNGNLNLDDDTPIDDIVLEFDVENESLSIRNVKSNLSQAIKTEKTRVKIKHDSDSLNKQVWVEKSSDSGMNAYAYNTTTGQGRRIITDSVYISSEHDPLIILNGQIISKNDMKNLESDQIKFIEVLKGDKAIKGYGTKGKDGVVMIHTKQNKDKNENWKMGYISRSLENDHVTELTSDATYIVNGKVASAYSAQLISPNNIKSVKVLKGEKASKLYGDHVVSGVVEIQTKDYPFSTKREAIITDLTFTDNKSDTTEFIINENTTDGRLEILEKEFKLKDMELKFSKVRRNKQSEITSIKISLNDNQGKESSVVIKNKNETIPEIIIGKNSDGLILRKLN